ncbi:MAG: hypothetical protein HKO62_09930, partial [Gammaproteobacteria bacterium]|nr:hypothetical protein [Gammaproteobacteria bacterium]
PGLPGGPRSAAPLPAAVAPPPRPGVSAEVAASLASDAADAAVGEAVDALNLEMDEISDAMQASLEAEIGALRDEVRALQAALAARVDTVEAAQRDTQRSVSGLYQQRADTDTSYLVAELEYLVTVAGRSLTLDRNVSAASAALAAAASRLAGNDHPDLLPIRARLLADISALEEVEDVDIAGLALFISDTIENVATLPLRQAAEMHSPFRSLEESAEPVSDWRGTLAAMWNDVRSLVEVSNSSLPEGVLFDPELRYFVEQNMRLELVAARIAMLQRDSANLTAAVTNVKALLERFYQVEDERVAALVARLDELAATDLRPPLPSLSATLDAIRALRLERDVRATVTGQ